MRYINNWDECEDGCLVIEDTYPEVYEVFTATNGVRMIRHIGSQLQSGADKPTGEERELDFEPNAMHDQPWLTYSGPVYC